MAIDYVKGVGGTLRRRVVGPTLEEAVSDFFHGVGLIASATAELTSSTQRAHSELFNLGYYRVDEAIKLAEAAYQAAQRRDNSALIENLAAAAAHLTAYISELEGIAHVPYVDLSNKSLWETYKGVLNLMRSIEQKLPKGYDPSKISSGGLARAKAAFDNRLKETLGLIQPLQEPPKR